MKRFISALLSLVFLLSVLPINVMAAEIGKHPEISVQSVSASLNSSVDVNVTIKNNVRILGAKLKVSYHDKLTLVGAQSGSAFSYMNMTKPGKLVSDCKFVWDGLQCPETLEDGTILTLRFQVADTAQNGDKLFVNISAESGDFCDNDLNSIEVTSHNGEVNVSDFTAGDVNNDTLVNTADIILMRRYIAGGYGVSLNQHAANVNADSHVNTADIITLRRYIAGGYDVTLKRCPTPCPLVATIDPIDPDESTPHTHSLKAVAYKAPTCTDAGNIAYWRCDGCSKYFSDKEGANEITQAKTVLAAMGHTVVTIPEVEPTDTAQGWTEGSKCSTCGKILVEPQPIPKPNSKKGTIVYDLYGNLKNDTYLKRVNIVNPSDNPTTYKVGEGVDSFEELCVNGYSFEGWYNGSGTTATRVNSISREQSGVVRLYAHWTKEVYTVKFDSPLSQCENKTYSIDTGTSLPIPTRGGYIFTGWTDANIEGNL